MALPIRQKQRVWLIIGFLTLGYAASKYDPEAASNANNQLTQFEQIVQQRQSDVQLEIDATVIKILADDNKGSRHQRFIVEVAPGRTILVAHNIDLAPRINTLKVGDTVTIYGEYEWNDKGGVMHWTHHDPSNRHITGWIRHQGKQYQ